MGRARDLFRKLENEGEAAIREFIAEKTSEELFLDFKRSADHGGGSKLHQDDRKNLARAISGFGNSEGGIIVWGVECSKDPVLGDIPTRTMPIMNPRRFVSWLESASSGCTLPSHPAVRHLPIDLSGNVGGFVVTFIPPSQLVPHLCIVEKNQYLIRAGSNFVPVPHGVLAGMFGRRPTAILSHTWQDLSGGISDDGSGLLIFITTPRSTPYARVSFLIRNDGLIPAEDLYFNASFVLPGPNCQVTMETAKIGWTIHDSVMGHHFMMESGRKIAPAAVVCPTSIELYLKPPFEQDLSYEITFGCSGSAVRQVVATRKRDEVGAVVSRLTLGNNEVPTAGQDFARFIFALDQPPSYHGGE